MTCDNTLLGRCTVALEEAINASDYPAHTTRTRRAGVAAVLEHLAAELLVLNQRNDRLTVHELSRLLLAAAQGEEVKA